MDKLHLYICENFYPEYQAVINKENFDDIELIVLPSLCDNKKGKEEAKEKLFKSSQDSSVLVCSNLCDLKKLTPPEGKIDVVSTNYCFGHLTCNEFLDYLTSKGSYIISTGWLSKWRSHITDMGFDKDTARKFFQETSKQIIFLDAKIDKEAENYLEELSDYIGIPYQVVSVELDTISLMLKSKLSEWNLQKQKGESRATINSLRSQSAEYAAVFDMLGKISTFTSKRDVIGKIKDLFTMVFGAQEFEFWGPQSVLESLELKKFKMSDDEYILFREKNKFYIKVSWNDVFYGILEVGGFMFEQYIDKYLNLAVEVAKFCGLVLHNNSQYQKILESEQELKYLSYHDCMTGLYNRTYINSIMDDRLNYGTVVFMFDIDNLKYINDKYGHAKGDELIERFAEVLKSVFRNQDIVARIGGDEFVAIIDNSTKEATKIVKQRFIEKIKLNNEKIKDQDLKLSASIGYAFLNNENNILEELMKKADKEMYMDKQNKKRRQ